MANDTHSASSEGTPLLGSSSIQTENAGDGLRSLRLTTKFGIFIGSFLTLAVLLGAMVTSFPQQNTSEVLASAVQIVPSYKEPLPDADLGSFPSGFVWGVATSAYQIEGATHEDGRGPSVWDVFVKEDGVISDGSNGDVADDHYHLWREDIQIMVDLNVSAYRFSISWSRILPKGRGEVNQKGIEFYDRLIDALLEKQIVPWITLFHWDLPQALEDDFGGWLDERTIDAFEEYSRVIFKHFSHKVKHFITLNEPWT